MDRKRENEEVIERLADVLDRLGVRYAIGGGVASALYGTVRFTRDADISVQPFSPIADKLYESLQDEFYISREAMEEALRFHGSFNIIHFETAFKIDLFIQGPTEFEERVLDRRRMLKLADISRRNVCVVSPEDIVLLKLRWFKDTDCTSERQWNDVLGVLRVQRESLDFGYLTDFAAKLGLEELLDRARAEANT
ncbi:MAG: nucleotidyltransferase [Sedimentisphaerales bacterium]|nr:nucleotidyltransferase [Sedimentisphaerales bacterium]